MIMGETGSGSCPVETSDGEPSGSTSTVLVYITK